MPKKKTTRKKTKKLTPEEAFIMQRREQELKDVEELRATRKRWEKEQLQEKKKRQAKFKKDQAMVDEINRLSSPSVVNKWLQENGTSSSK